MSDSDNITRNALAGSQFLESAIVEGNKAVQYARSIDGKSAEMEFDQHVDCALHHFRAAFEEARKWREENPQPPKE
jgi:hypothetical protein